MAVFQELYKEKVASAHIVPDLNELDSLL